MESHTMKTSDLGTATMEVDKSTLFKTTFKRFCQRSTEDATDALTQLDIVAKGPGCTIDEWVLQAYVSEEQQLIVAAFWRDAQGQMHAMDVQQLGAINVAAWTVDPKNIIP